MLINREDLIYRMICLFTFIIVIAFVESKLSLIILDILLFGALLFKESFSRFLLLLFFLLNFIIVLFGNIFLIRIVLIIGYIYYFIYCVRLNGSYDKYTRKYYTTILKDNYRRIKSLNKSNIKNNLSSKSMVDYRRKEENLLMRFDNLRVNKKYSYLYVLVHMVVLIIVIMVG